jgi:hypothetical protein
VNRDQLARLLEIAKSLAMFEGLQPPDLITVKIDKKIPHGNTVTEGLVVDEYTNILYIEDTTIDNLVYRILAGIFYLSIWNTYMAKSPGKACELARKHFFKTLIRITGGSR